MYSCFFPLCCLQVCGHISKCYSVAAQFEECREKITEMPGIIKDLCRVLYFGKVELMVIFLDAFSSGFLVK